MAKVERRRKGKGRGKVLTTRKEGGNHLNLQKVNAGIWGVGQLGCWGWGCRGMIKYPKFLSAQHLSTCSVFHPQKPFLFFGNQGPLPSVCHFSHRFTQASPSVYLKPLKHKPGVREVHAVRCRRRRSLRFRLARGSSQRGGS